MKKKYLILIAILILILSVIIIIFNIINNKDENYLKEIDYIEYIEKVHNEENFILYVKQTHCNHCQSFTPKFSNVLEKYKLEAFSINLTNLEDNESVLFLNDLSIDSTPNVLFFKNGVELGSYSRIEGSKSEEYIIKRLKLNGYIKEENSEE